MDEVQIPENWEYEWAQYSRTDWLEDDPEGEYFGALTYVGDYCIITGISVRPNAGGVYETAVWVVDGMCLQDAVDDGIATTIEIAFSNDYATTKKNHEIEVAMAREVMG